MLSSNRQANDGSSTSAMSNLSNYSLIEDDHIDDQETINVGNLIIDLESDLEKEKIENEQQANAKPTNNACSASTTTSSSSSSSSSKAAAPTSSSNHHSSSSTTSSASSTDSTSATYGGGGGGGSTSSKSGKSEHKQKPVTSPNCSSSSGVVGNHHASIPIAYANSYNEAMMHESSSSAPKPSQSSSISSTKECGTSTSIGTITEPECLGPCEPGTSVTLEGIVWQETEGGILVVNVTWRGKTYVGALLDCTKHDWAPPRLCDSPTSDIDSKTNKGVRTKRIVTRSNGIGLDEKNLLQTTGKLRNGKGRRILASSDLASCSKRQRDTDKSNDSVAAQPEANAPTNQSSISISESSSSVLMNIDTAAPNDSISTSNISTDKAGPNSPMLIGCNEPNCSKKYRNMNGLLYHQTYAHGNDNDSSNYAPDNNCSSSGLSNSPCSSSIKSKSASKDDQPEETKSAPPAEVEGPPSLVASWPRANLNPDLSRVSAQMVAYESKSQEQTKPIYEPPVNPRHSSDHGPGQATGLSSSAKEQPVPISAPIPIPAPVPAPVPVPISVPVSVPAPVPISVPVSVPASVPMSVPMPPTTEEGMRPSGTSTGPPPAPHQANCYFNPAFLANNFNPYLPPYFPRMPLPPMYDPLASPTSTNAFLSRFMSNPRPPQPPPPPPPSSESPSRLMNPSVPPFKMGPGGLPPLPPSSQLRNPTGLPPIPPLMSGPPHLRMPNVRERFP